MLVCCGTLQCIHIASIEAVAEESMSGQRDRGTKQPILQDV